MSHVNKIVTVTIDGPSGSGKSSISQLLAHQLDFGLLDSGALYRLVAWLADKTDKSVLSCCQSLCIQDIEFKPNPEGKSASIIFRGTDVSDQLRTPGVAQQASKVAVDIDVRQALIEIQRSFREKGSLIAEGRDMGTTIFPDADVKIYLTASLSQRVKRRAKQLQSAGQAVNIVELEESIRSRDLRDSSRQESPLKAADDATLIDTSNLSFNQAVDLIMNQINETH